MSIQIKHSGGPPVIDKRGVVVQGAVPPWGVWRNGQLMGSYYTRDDAESVVEMLIAEENERKDEP